MTAAALSASLATLAKATRAQAASRGPGASLHDPLRSIREQLGLPALAAAVVRDGAIVASGAVFPELAGGMDGGLRGVAPEQLLSHASGSPSDTEAFGKLLGESLVQDGLNLDELRYWLVRRWSTQPLVSKPGAMWAYSSMGYTMAGAMLERTGKQTWEELVVARLFGPLGLRSAGFGPQASLGRLDAPIGHGVRKDGTLKPMLARPDGDNPAIIGPAGTCTCPFSTLPPGPVGTPAKVVAGRRSCDRKPCASCTRRRSRFRHAIARRLLHGLGYREGTAFAGTRGRAFRLEHDEPCHSGAATRA